MEPEDMIARQAAWIRLMQRFRIASPDAMPVFELLTSAYGSPDRYYHNLEHLDEMFRVAGRLAAITDDLRAVQLAIWFHDAVYDPRAKDNESRSADLAILMLSPIGMPRSELECTTRLILATAHLANPQPPPDRETAVLLDADLAILGASVQRYDQYAAAIRKEYAWVPNTEYRPARSSVLERFLSRPRLFWTDAMHEEFDAAARENLRRELEQLHTNAPRP